MRVCLILEGCYPYIRGGVSSWAHEYILSNPDIEFVLWTIHAARKYTGTPVYTLPENVVESHEIYLEDTGRISRTKAKHRNYADYISSIRQFIEQDGFDWERLFSTCCDSSVNIQDLTSSEEFLAFATEIAEKSSNKTGLSDAYYGLRSMLLPIMFLLQQEIPKADLYHSAVAGYGGMIGAMAKYKTGKPFILTEHGIYPREREEELIQAEWVAPSMRDNWILSFYNSSRCAYFFADRVTALFSDARDKQIEIGCDAEKCVIVANGIHAEKFIDIPLHDDPGIVNIGAFVRFAAIKDVKTLIYSFYTLQKAIPNSRLYIMGGTDDEAYKHECEDLIRRLRLSSIHIEGHIDTIEYMKKMDFTVMSSISEGQPLAILESLAAARPVVTTNVGNCYELLQADDGCGQAGFCCQPMDSDGLAEAMKELCVNTELRRTFGFNGRARVLKKYTHAIMNSRYLGVYHEVM